MNISTLINDIKLVNGLYTIALPFEESIDTVMQKIIQVSIRTFSDFKPNKKETHVMRDALKAPSEWEEKQGIYILPAPLTTTHVKYAEAYIESNLYGEEVNINAFTVGSPFVGFGSYYPTDIINATLTGAAINKFTGVSSTQPSSKWLGYNKIQLFNFPKKCALKIIASCEHDLNCESIPESCWESFKELATYDIQITLYNTIKNMNNLGSAFKEIQLKIDDWGNAIGKREELLNNWKNTFHYDNINLVQFF